MNYRKRNTPSGLALKCTIELPPQELFTEVEEFVNNFWIDVSEKNEIYFKDFQAKWEKPDRKITVQANKYRNRPEGSNPLNITPIFVIDMQIKTRIRSLYVEVYFYGETSLTKALCNHLVQLPGANTHVLGGMWVEDVPTPDSSQSNLLQWEDSVSMDLQKPKSQNDYRPKPPGRKPDPENDEAYRMLQEGKKSREDVFDYWCEKKGIKEFSTSKDRKRARDAFRQAMNRAEKRLNRT